MLVSCPAVYQIPDGLYSLYIYYVLPRGIPLNCVSLHNLCTASEHSRIAFLCRVPLSSVVGYNTYQTSTLRQPSFGACFIPVGGGSTYKLGDLKPADFDPDNDIIALINPTTLGTDAQYVYMSKEIADAAAIDEGAAGDYDELIGWWDAALGVGEDGAKADNVSINVGQAFLGLFESGNDIGFLSCGEAPAVSTSISTGSAKQPFFASYIPKTITLSQIVADDFDPDNDVIAVINPTTLGTDAQYVYMSKEIADAAAIDEGGAAGDYDELIGWWDAVLGVGEDGAKADNVNVTPGAAFLGLFESGNDITFNFPPAVTE